MIPFESKKTVLCLIKVNSKTIEITMHTSCYCILDLLCVTFMKLTPGRSVINFACSTQNLIYKFLESVLNLLFRKCFISTFYEVFLIYSSYFDYKFECSLLRDLDLTIYYIHLLILGSTTCRI